QREKNKLAEMRQRQDQSVGGRVDAGAGAVIGLMSGLRVLVVEDNAIIAMLYADLLEEFGHVVCAIETTEAGAVATAARCKPDLMIVDVSLSEGSGMSAVEQILRGGFVPHVFISGDATSVLAIRPDAIVLQKPFVATDLTHAMQRAFIEAQPI
ncbi:MAG TPA: response regulator, partial [Aestuariivirga sp.]